MEVKGQGRDGLGNKDEKELFSIFMEDYNTATFPDEK